ncbi:hypothetical protein PVAP13_6NG104300 [Panicum virgatum]|uniref:Fatty acyl-CoA reductase n=1 Tax=Panicum virgatum TaxID=38727 RepID=A0A8T0QX31_PANVG|nr:hypothetical protein PVAP13_6NG104300 [Panicum virgatum]
MIGELDADAVVGYFRGKSILITGSTGFLGKVLVEKILRVQPDVKKLFLLIRAADIESAKHRVATEVTGREIFQVLKQKHGDKFDDFIQEKVCPLAGDIVYKNLGLDNAKLTELSKEIDIIVNGAATTNFYERYDVTFDTNVMGAKHICEFTKRCNKLKMLLHVSTAYVAGEQEGILPEKPFLLGETLREGAHLDIESELNLIKEARKEVKANCSSERVEKRTMKELGLKRTIDSFIIGSAKQALSIFLVDLNLIMDVRYDGVAIAAHSEDQAAQSIYHVTSSLRNPAPYAVLVDSGHRYFLHNPPRFEENGEPVRLSRMCFFQTLPRFRAYMAVKFRLPLEILRLRNIAMLGAFSRRYGDLSRKYRYVMHMAELYAPYALFKGWAALMKANKQQGKSRGYDFGFDPKSIDWDKYFYSVHIPGVIKYLCD